MGDLSFLISAIEITRDSFSLGVLGANNKYEISCTVSINFIINKMTRGKVSATSIINVLFWFMNNPEPKINNRG